MDVVTFIYQGCPPPPPEQKAVSRSLDYILADGSKHKTSYFGMEYKHMTIVKNSLPYSDEFCVNMGKFHPKRWDPAGLKLDLICPE